MAPSDDQPERDEGRRVVRHFLFDGPIDEEILPFSPDANATNRYFADLIHDYVATKRELAEVRQLLQACQPGQPPAVEKLLAAVRSRPAMWVVLAALLLTTAWLSATPRYEWRSTQYSDQLLRVDRWTGKAELGVLRTDWGRWVPISELQAAGIYYR